MSATEVHSPSRDAAAGTADMTGMSQYTAPRFTFDTPNGTGASPHERGQARQISPGQKGCRRSSRSPAPPLRYEPARIGGGVSPAGKRDMRPARLFSFSLAQARAPPASLCLPSASHVK
jgi:hypothetical protein